MRKPSKLETNEKQVQQAYKGKTWKRDTSKRNYEFNGLQGV